MITTNNKKKYGFFVYNTHHEYVFLNNKTESNNGSGMMNLLIQVREKKDYNCKKANHGAEMILKKKLEKINYGLVVKINQTQAHHFNKKENYKSAKIDNVA